MALHPLNDNQIAFLEEYRSSGMTVLEFAKHKSYLFALDHKNNFL